MNRTVTVMDEDEGASLLPLQIFVAVIPFFTGIFFEWESAIVSMFLAGYIVFSILKNKRLIFRPGLILTMTLVIVVMYLLSYFWAVDRGMALFGFIKFLPLPLFVIAADQTGVPVYDRELLSLLPYSGAVMTLVSILLSCLDILKGHIVVRERLGGFFEYPNTFAMFLLICLMLTVFRDKIGVKEGLIAAVLVTGIVMSGSRSVVILLILAAFVFILRVKSKKLKIATLAAIGVAVAGISVYVAVSGKYESIGRIFTTFTESSTFNGRLLYYKDAIPVITSHPAGLGYYGYYYSQGAFQTGVYSVVHVHNDILQVLLDVGFFPAALCIIAFIKSFVKGSAVSKIILAFAGIHILFDFDLQFIAMDIIMLAVMFTKPRKTPREIRRIPVRISSVIAILGVAAVSVIFGLASFLFYVKDYDGACSIWPSYSEAQFVKLSMADKADEVEMIADDILARNPDSALANSAKASALFSKGDIKEMVLYKERAIDNNRYSMPEYINYIDMLQYAASLYIDNNDTASAAYCFDHILSVPSKLKNVKDTTSEIAWKINDKPDLELPAEYQEYVDQLRSILA